MKKQLLLLIACCVSFAVFAQLPQFSFPLACQPPVFSSDPLFVGAVSIDGVDAEVGVDSIAVFDENDNVIIADVIQNGTSGGSTYVGFGFRLRAEDMTCAGYSLTAPVTLVFYDASNPGCKFKTALNGSFVVSIAQPVGTPIDFVVGPDNDVNQIDVFDFDGSSCVVALPVDFTAFHATTAGNAVKLDWTTGKEENNSHFEVETTVDGEIWDKIGTVAGAGNSDESIRYDFVDASPSVGQNLYRIKQVDFDGSFTYSSIATVNFKSDAATTVKLYPNPITASNTTLSLEGDWNNAVATLHDFSGRKVANFTNLSSGSTTVELPELPAGVYQLVVTDEVSRKVVRVVIR